MNKLADHQTRVRQLFDEKAQSWNDKFAGFFRNRVDLFLDAVRQHGPPQARILDFGCGTGNFLVALATEGHTLVGVDLSRDMLKQCARNLVAEGLSARLLQPSELQSEAGTGPYDVIVCSSVLEYVESPVDQLRQLKQMLEPSGVMLVTMPNRESNLKRRQRMIRAFAPVLRCFGWLRRLKSYLEFLDVSVNVCSAEEFHLIARAAELQVRDWCYFRSVDGKRDKHDRRGCEMMFFVLECTPQHDAAG